MKKNIPEAEMKASVKVWKYLGVIKETEAEAKPLPDERMNISE